MKILLAEDDLNIATIAKIALGQIGGHEVDHAVDGEEALRMAKKNQYDVILLDEMMPKMSGPDMCTKYLASGSNISPIIFMSANARKSDEQGQVPEGAIGFIAKPFDPTKLAEQVENLVSMHTQGKAG